MRCSEVELELLTPEGRVAPEALAGHLAACARCSDRASAARRLERSWAATRPVEPSPAAFNRIWAGVTAALDVVEPAPVRLQLTTRPVASPARWRTFAGFALAAAAGLALAMLPMLGRDGGGPEPPEGAPPSVSAPTAVALARFEFEQGSTAIIRIDSEATAERRTPVDVSETETRLGHDRHPELRGDAVSDLAGTTRDRNATGADRGRLFGFSTPAVVLVALIGLGGPAPARAQIMDRARPSVRTPTAAESAGDGLRPTGHPRRPDARPEAQADRPATPPGLPPARGFDSSAPRPTAFRSAKP